MAKITDKQRAKLAVQNMRALTMRSWSEIFDAHAKQMLDDVVARSKADSDGLGPLPIPLRIALTLKARRRALHGAGNKQGVEKMENYWSDQAQNDLDALFDRLVAGVKQSERPDMETKGYLAGMRMAFKYLLFEIVDKEAGK